jgi:hypothetical protein
MGALSSAKVILLRPHDVGKLKAGLLFEALELPGGAGGISGAFNQTS